MIKKLIEKRADYKKQLDDLLGKAKTEERAMTPEETAEFDRIEGEIKNIDKTIDAEKRAMSLDNFHPPMANPVPDADETKKMEERAFENYILGVTENRAGEQNLTMGNNGAIIPESIANRIIDKIRDICPILSGAEMYHVKGTLKIPKWTVANSTHDVTVGYATEFQEVTADSGKFTSIDLGGYLAAALVLIGKSVENNSEINVVDFVINKIAEKVSAFIEDQLLNGTGTSQAQGILSCSNTVTAANNDKITVDDLIELQGAVKQAYQQGACWTMNNDTFTAIKKIKDTTGRMMIQTDASKAFPYTLLGKPVYLSDAMPKIEAEAKTVLYGNYSALAVNFRENINVQILREKYATQHALGVICWFEFDSKVIDEQKCAVLVQAAASSTG